MPGLRIHHPTERSVVLLVQHPGRGLRRSQPKTIPIHLDEEGNSIVSTGVWEDIQEATVNTPEHHFIVLNEVSDPPTIIAGLNHSQAPEMRTLEARPEGGVSDSNLQMVAQTFAPKGIRPRITRNT